MEEKTCQRPQDLAESKKEEAIQQLQKFDFSEHFSTVYSELFISQ